MSNSVPSPSLDPIVGRYTGHALQLFCDRFQFMKKSMQTHGSILKFRYMDQSVWLISDPDYLEKIFAQEECFTRRTLGGLKFEQFIGKGSVTLEGEEWKKRRRINQPYFNQKMINTGLKNYQDILEKRLQSCHSETDALTFASRLNLDFITSALFKVDLNESYDDLMHTLDGLLKAASYQISKTFPLPLPQDIWMKNVAQNSILKMKNHVRKIIATALLSDENNIVKDLHASGVLSPPEIEEEVRSLILAGFETSASALTWALFELAQRPDWQEKIRAEYNQYYSSLTSMQDLSQKMIFTQAFIMETLRIYSPIWSASRKAVKSTEIKDVWFSLGDLILISPYMCHHNPRNFENPEAFMPERFIKEGKLEEPKGYLPFGFGPRLCVGKQMSMTTLTLTLAAVTGRFFLSTSAKDPGYFASITLRPKKKIVLSFKPLGKGL